MTSRDVQRFGPYVILERIGDGGMAEIFLAKMQGYSGFEKLLALKKILPRYSQNRTFAQMLIHEAKLAAALQHFNVVQVLDLGEIDRQVFVAMEYVRGRDLAAVLSNTYRRKERLPLNLVLCIATEFITGLEYAHRVRNADGIPLGIIHRDISPQNVLISYEGEVKVTDFGIARVLSEKEGFQLPGNLHGKFGYMSPEQVLGEEIDQRSDIFSAGVVLYEMLTGQRLFRAKEQKDTIKMIVSNEIPAPSSINPEVPPAVDRIVAKALARDRTARYQTMGALLGELSRVADTLPRRAATRDLAVYMRRQFGIAATGHAALMPPRSDTTERSGSFRSPSELSGLGGAAPQKGVQRIPLGAILIDQGGITPAELDIALAEQRARGGRIGELLIASGSVSEDALLRALATQTGLPVMNDPELLALEPPAKLLLRFPREAAETTMMLPIRLDEEKQNVQLAVGDPYDDRAILEAKVVLGVANVEVLLAKRSAIRATINAWYGAEPEAAPDEPVFAEPSGARTELTPLPRTVLIADGDPESVAELLARVREEDCEVIAASDGKTARQLCREHLLAVAILDAGLPGIDGFNVLLELRARNNDAAVFITSSRGDEHRQAKALELGADDFFVKPLAIELTTSKIRRELQKRAGVKKPGAPPVPSHGISGSLRDMTALDIVQMLELGRKTARVSIQYNDGRQGELFVESGGVLGAVSGNLIGEEAFYQLARPAPGMFRIEYKPSTRLENLTKPNTFLLMEAMRRLDEAEHPELAARPPAPRAPSTEGEAPAFSSDLDLDLPTRPGDPSAPRGEPLKAAPLAAAPLPPGAPGLAGPASRSSMTPAPAPSTAVAGLGGLGPSLSSMTPLPGFHPGAGAAARPSSVRPGASGSPPRRGTPAPAGPAATVVGPRATGGGPSISAERQHPSFEELTPSGAFNPPLPMPMPLPAPRPRAPSDVGSQIDQLLSLASSEAPLAPLPPLPPAAGEPRSEAARTPADGGKASTASNASNTANTANAAKAGTGPTSAAGPARPKGPQHPTLPPLARGVPPPPPVPNSGAAQPAAPGKAPRPRADETSTAPRPTGTAPPIPKAQAFGAHSLGAATRSAKPAGVASPPSIGAGAPPAAPAQPGVPGTGKQLASLVPSLGTVAPGPPQPPRAATTGTLPPAPGGEAAQHAPAPRRSPPPVPTPPAAGASQGKPAAPSPLHALTGDLVLDGMAAPRPASPPSADLLTSAGLGSGIDVPEPTTEPGMPVPARTNPPPSGSNPGSGPATIGRIPIRRTIQVVERIEEGVSDPAQRLGTETDEPDTGSR